MLNAQAVNRLYTLQSVTVMRDDNTSVHRIKTTQDQDSKLYKSNKTNAYFRRYMSASIEPTHNKDVQKNRKVQPLIVNNTLIDWAYGMIQHK